ncbi:MAG: tryptophan--tRNA ligase, partial [Candidatus Cloacimonetes bacterium]|nr:tryptophan--tRNA ligase [Candidatus Cloacimonadota bacterium]
VGKDQAQHLEMTIDIAQSVNHIYKKDVLTIPKPLIREATQTVIGLDGRKMSKSYNNTIPLFLPTKKLRKLIMKVVTNSQTIEEVKDPDKCNVFTLYKLFTSNDQQNILREKYLAGGMGWGHAKQELFEVMEEMVSPMREKYDELMNNKDFIDKLLDEGSEKAQEIASEKMKLVKNILGFK